MDNIHTVFTQVINRPARKFILKRGRKAETTLSTAARSGAMFGESWSLKGALYEPIGAWLPKKLRKPGTSQYVQELRCRWTPERCRTAWRSSARTLPGDGFQGPPYPEEKMGEAINAVWKAIDRFDPLSTAGSGPMRTRHATNWLRSGKRVHRSPAGKSDSEIVAVGRRQAAHPPAP